MYSEDDLLPISGLQHLAFCERQWALIHLEGLWAENRLTVEGDQLHERAHDGESEARGDLRVARGLRVRSLRLGLTGAIDVVEFRRAPAGAAGIRLNGVAGRWIPLIVEYKRGRPKPDLCDEVQVCAQALCLEEMLGVQISGGCIFYGEPRRRHDVPFSEGLRQETESLAERMHRLTREGTTPPAQFGSACRSCSLVDLCLPRATQGRSNVGRYLADALLPPTPGEESE